MTTEYASKQFYAETSSFVESVFWEFYGFLGDKIAPEVSFLTHFACFQRKADAIGQ